MATVRIYRVAELLNTTSQEVMALLKRDHGIEVKSASSTIEEVVGRQFVDRLARQRGVTLPSGDVFAEGAAAKAAPKKPALVKKGGAPEPAKPAAPSLGPPRLVKAAKAIHQAERAAAASHELDGDAVAEHEPTDIHDTHAEAEVDHAPVEEVPVTHVTHAPEPEHEVELPVAEFPAVETADTDTLAAAAAELTQQAPPIPLPTGVVHQPSGRIVPPSLRLRIEDPNAPVTPRPPAARPAPPQPRPGQAPAAARPGTPGIMGPASRTGTPTVAPPRPGVLPPRPAPPGGPRPSYQTPQTLGGPRPLPSQPVRPQQPGMGARPGMPGRPGMPPPGGARPGQPGGWRPPPPRPSGGRRHTARPEQPRGSMAPTGPRPIT